MKADKVRELQSNLVCGIFKLDWDTCVQAREVTREEIDQNISIHTAKPLLLLIPSPPLI